ncbi:MAG: T9SS type A sorting domain-containing protein [Salibacteraceae bacterium]
MRLPLLLLALLLPTMMWAQITITSNEMPLSGDTLRFSRADPNSVDVVPTGPNFTWNFNTLTPINQGIDEYESSSSTPYAFFFFNTYGLKIADTVGIGAFSLTNVYSFFKSTNGAFTAEGSGLSYNGLPIPANYSDEDEIFSLPLDFNDFDSTTYAVSFSLTTILNLVQQGSRVNEVDGWGTITTPYGTFDCLRVKSTLFERDSISIHGIGTSFPVTRQEYRWVTLNERFPILEVTGTLAAGNFVAAQVRYRDIFRSDSIGTGIATVERPFIGLYPNPAQEQLQLTIPAALLWQTARLLNLQGQVVREWTLSETAATFNVAELSRGTYFLYLPGASAPVVEKIVLE